MAKQLTKGDLQAEIQRERAALEEYLSALAPEQLAQPGVVGHWSAADVVAHLTEWHQLNMGWYAAGRRGETPALPAEGFSWRQLAQLNQVFYERHRGEQPDAVLAAFRESSRAIDALIGGLSEEELFAPGAQAWTGKKPLAVFVAANTSEHYRWARKEIAKGLRAASRAASRAT